MVTVVIPWHRLSVVDANVPREAIPPEWASAGASQNAAGQAVAPESLCVRCRSSRKENSVTASLPATTFTPSSQSSPFAWHDPFLLDDQLSEDERMIRDSAKAFAEAELRPRVLS